MSTSANRVQSGASTRHILALAALVGGAMAMGISPVFVRYAEVGPFTSAFYRVFLALPALWLWARLEAGGADAKPDPGWTRAIVLAGVFFAGNLFFWHLAIFNTSIANATLLATMAPVWVALFSGLFIGEPVTRLMIVGLGLCMAGAALLVGSSAGLGHGRLIGDLYGVGTSLFFGLYFLAMRVARREAASGMILLRSTVVTTIILAAVAGFAENSWVPTAWSGVAALLAMALISHTGGQGLLAYALGHLSAAFSSLVIFLEALCAAFFGWLLFNETLTLPQIAGGLAILLGIWIARPR
jgi:drug/metabolite transporter (DMT)-like permease